ncbi:MAG: hypothetical protein IK122_00520 [Alphaproteobacteria bacterium]|nr:hypothetical protein [Alphaproteobacteria bacterium]
MKKYTLALALAVLLPGIAGAAYDYNQPREGYYTQRPTAKKGTYKKASTTRKTGGYTNVVSNNFYYGQSAQVNAQPSVQPVASVERVDGGYYRNSNAGTYRSESYYARQQQPAEVTKTKKTVRKSYATQERKFFLAHPFFQPLKGHVGSVTDFSYARNKFDFDLLNGRTVNLDTSSASYLNATPIGTVNIGGKAETSQFAVKEDLSYGLTDTLALVLMAQYDKTKVSFKDWSVGGGNDTKSDSGLNLFGIGLQNRFVDNNDWIVMGEAFFEHQKDTANMFMLGLKAGYKIDRTTVYGIGRFVYTNLTNGNIYGAYVDDSTGDYLMLSYNTDVKNLLYVEGGVGAFAVLNKYFTLNGELIYGHYDWHNQLYIKGAIGWQPADMFALNLYASTSLYDSAKNKVRRYMNYDVNPTDYPEVDGSPVFTDSKLLYTDGDYKIKNYDEWKIGVQAILYF